MILDLLAAMPRAADWSPTIGAIMIASNIFAFILGKLTIQYQNEGPELPGSAIIGGISIPALLATTSFGHIIGTGVILGLSNSGLL